MVAFHTYSAQNNYSGDYSFFKELNYWNMLVLIKVLCASNIEKKKKQWTALRKASSSYAT